ncbi:hypothetical protein [Actinoplanes sp. NPDC049118]|uniref:hypothetical protein n=1 Tax=Actinoplanes sp. NPDC049118 TaxID=3155769 RepID=UPI0034010CB1
MSRIRKGIFGALTAAALTTGVLLPGAAAQAAAGGWYDVGWYRYKSTCEAEGKKAVNRDRHDAFTDWRCQSDSPGYRLLVFQVYGS